MSKPAIVVLVGALFSAVHYSLLTLSASFACLEHDDSFLSRTVGQGSCEEGTSIYDDGNTCEDNAEVCTVLTTGISIPGINLPLALPTGCDENDVDKPLCEGQVQWRVLGSGTVKKIEPTSCGLKEKHLCREVPHGPFCTNIGAGHGDWVQDIIDYFEDYYGDDVVDVDYDPNTGMLCLTADMFFKKCEKHTPSPYSCGSHYAEVANCTE